jgi:CIC family chloride channel protein
MRQWLDRVPGMGVLTEDRTGAFLLISVLVGAAVGLGAAALIWSIEAMSALVDRGIEGLGGDVWWWLIPVPIGLLLAWAVSRRFAPETMGSGIAETVEDLTVHNGRLRTVIIPTKLVASMLTIGGGGSGGREGPVVQLGGAIGSSIARRFGLGEDMVRSLVAAGAGAGIGASFNAPIAGMLFALEVILGTLSVRHTSAIVLASVTAAVTTGALVGDEAILSARPYSLGDPRELLLYLVLALVVIGVAIPFLRLEERGDGLSERLRGASRPLVLGLAVAGVAIAQTFLLGGDEPQVLRSGQDLLGQFINIDAATNVAWWTLAALALFKIVTSILTHSSGGSAGLFMPSLFIGGAIGVAFGEAVAGVWTFSEIQPGAFAVVGMATMFAAVGRAPLTSILIVFEITGSRNYGLVLPLMLAATLATFLAERVHPLSLYTGPLARRGINVAKAGEIDLLDTVPVGSVMTVSPLRVRDTTPVETVRAELDKRRSHGAPVVDRPGHLVGIVTVTDLARARSDSAPASEVMTTRPVTVTASTPVSQALERMAALGIGRLPVVADDDPERLVGLFRREDAVTAYHQALGSSTGGELHRSRLRLRTDPGARYFEFRIPPGSMADRRTVKEVTWPEGSTLVSIRRGTIVLVPSGTTELLAGDVVTAFGTEGSERRLIERLNAGAEEPTAEMTIEMPAQTPPGPT